MPAAASKPAAAPIYSATVSLPSEGRAVVVLKGRLDAQSTAAAWKELELQLGAKPLREFTVDAAGLEFCDGAGFALLHFLSLGGMTAGIRGVVQGLKPEYARFYNALTEADYRLAQEEHAPKGGVVAEAGRWSAALLRDLREQIVFMGAAALGISSCLFQPKRMRWGEIARVFELAGVNALPIVSLISLLVGLIIAFESAQPLAQFGAQIYIANMIGLVMVRELGPLMTAILLAGRSGSAFAAELGTMKVNEELNALETMGLDPMRFLVVQRVTAGVLLTPLLTVYSMLMGIAGGVIVMAALGFPLAAIHTQLVSSLGIKDVMVGVTKGLVFGIVVSAVGCLRGMQTAQGPSAVGASTTRAVVSGILLIILVDALFSILLFVLDQ